MRGVAALLLLLCGAGAAVAASDPCAKYADADAYNYCLAASGPAAHARHFTGGPDRAAIPQARRPVRHAATRAPQSELPPGMIRKPAPRGRVRFQIMLR
jgi:hypothetical protein